MCSKITSRVRVRDTSCHQGLISSFWSVEREILVFSPILTGRPQNQNGDQNGGPRLKFSETGPKHRVRYRFSCLLGRRSQQNVPKNPSTHGYAQNPIWRPILALQCPKRQMRLGERRQYFKYMFISSQISKNQSEKYFTPPDLIWTR